MIGLLFGLLSLLLAGGLAVVVPILAWAKMARLERELAGRFQGLDEMGRLLLDQAGTVTAVTAGEVFGFGGH